MSNPFQDAANQLDGADQNAAPEKPVIASGNPFEQAASDLEQEPVQEPQPGQKVQGAGTPDNPFQAVIQYGEMLQKARQVGQAGFREAALGHAVMDGRMTFEDAQGQIEADDSLAHMSSDLAQDDKDSAVPWLTGITLETAKQLPMIEASLAPFAGGAAVGAGGMAATGIGAPVAIPFGLTTGSAATA
ncbi:MAG: hypothetical protein K2X27_15955, partial [Candidatus Obscuribacterales bacterium]|nr:hypothetical protein [Candidatus Obscuribacterales bacterium]